MRIFLFKLVVFISIVGLVVVYISTFDNLNLNNANISRVRLAKKFDSLDFLFVGNSHVYSGIDPQYFDSAYIKTFDLSIATAGPYYDEILIDDYLSQVTIKPKCLVFSFSPLLFNSRSDNWVLYPIHRYLNKPISHLSIYAKYPIGIDVIPSIHKSFIKGLKNIFIANNKSSLYFDSLTLKRKGFYPDTAFLRKNGPIPNFKVYQGFDNLIFDTKKADYFVQLLDKYRDLGINVILCEIPTLNLAGYFNSEYMKKFNLLKAALLQNKTQIIENKLILGPLYFKNIDHMNSAGATVYTRYLIKKLLKNENGPMFNSTR